MFVQPGNNLYGRRTQMISKDIKDKDIQGQACTSEAKMAAARE